MAKTPEGKVKEEVDAILSRVKAYNTTPTTGGFGKSGTADRIACIPDARGGVGYFLSVEVKAGKNKPTALQRLRLQETIAAGGYAAVVNETNLDAFSDWVEAIHGGIETVSNVLLPVGITLSIDTKVGL